MNYFLKHFHGNEVETVKVCATVFHEAWNMTENRLEVYILLYIFRNVIFLPYYVL